VYVFGFNSAKNKLRYTSIYEYGPAPNEVYVFNFYNAKNRCVRIKGYLPVPSDFSSYMEENVESFIRLYWYVTAAHFKKISK